MPKYAYSRTDYLNDTIETYNKRDQSFIYLYEYYTQNGLEFIRGQIEDDYKRLGRWLYKSAEQLELLEHYKNALQLINQVGLKCALETM